MPESHVWVISGPSGVGKGTVCARLKELHPEVFYSVSWTTRPARPKERGGTDYHFVQVAEFEELIEREEMLEWAVVHGTHYYGTPRTPVFEALAHGRQVVLEIDLQGARQIKANLPDARLIFLTPPSWEELVNRLRGRGTEDDAAQQRRLDTAKAELSAVEQADHVICNAEIEETVAALVDLMGL